MRFPPPVAWLPELQELFWWGLFVSLLLAATAHLVVMLSTRWGDRGTNTKGFLFSLICHGALLCLVLAMKPGIDRMLGEVGEPRAEQQRRFQVGSLRPDAAESPSPDRVPDPWRSDMTPDPRALTRSEAPDRPWETAPNERVRPEERALEPVRRLETSDRPVTELPTPDRSDAAPAPVGEAAPDLAAMTPESVAAPVAPAPETVEGPRPAPRTKFDPNPESVFQPIPRRGPISADPFAAPPTLTERTEAPLPVARRTDEERGPGPVRSEAPVGPTPGGVAAAPPAPELPADDPPPAEEPAGPSRTMLPSETPLVAANPRRARTLIPTKSADPLADAGLSERPTDLAPRVERADDGPRVVVTSSDGPPPAPGVPDAYRLRNLEKRVEIAKEQGGTVESEAAVEAALAWFARSQEPAGYWDASEHRAGRGSDDDPVAEPDPDKRNTGRNADAGLTGLVTLTFLGAGYTRTGGKYAPSVDRAVRWLAAQQQEDGSLAGEANYYARMYSHGIATYALAEALALEGDRPDPGLRRAVRKAVDYIVAQQYPDGGWRYSQRFRTGDVSMFGWQCMALKSADNAGIPTPPETRARMIGFLRDRSETTNDEGELVQSPYGGLARYKQEEGHTVTPAMTAEALFCKQILGLRRDQPAAREAVAYLDLHPPELKTWNLYQWYYGSLALHAHGGPAWDRWNERLLELLLEEQYARGPEAGTWPVRPNRFNYTEYGGTLYSTAMATLCLEVYYRFSPASGGGAAMDGRP